MPQRRRPQIEVPQYGRECDDVLDSVSPNISPRTISLQAVAKSARDIIRPIDKSIKDTTYDASARRRYSKAGLEDGRRERMISKECTSHVHGSGKNAFISPISLEGFRPRLAGRKTVSAREMKVDGEVLREEDSKDGERDSDGEVDDVDESDLDRQRNLAPYHVGETVSVRCNRSEWHSGKITTIGDEGVRLWVDLAHSTITVPLPLVTTHLRRVPSPAPSQPEQQGLPSGSSASPSAGVIHMGGGLSPSASSCSSRSLSPVATPEPHSLEASAPSATVVKMAVHAVRPSHLSHR